MEFRKSTQHYLYHIRDAECSSGVGFDGYVGITDNPYRRKKQHFEALAKGCHPNEKLQAAYNKAPHRYRFWLVTAGSKESIEARERLFVPKDDHLLNKQKGGGHRRGMSQEEAIRAISDTAEAVKDELRKERDDANTGATGNSTSSRGAKDADDEQSRNGSKSNAKGNSGARANANSNSNSSGKGSAAGAAGLAADIAAGATVVAATVASGLGTAYLINKHVLNDDESLEQDERDARKSGRVGSYAGGGAGAAAAVTMVCAAGEVGLGVAGVSTGLTAIGATVGGGAAVGAGIALAVPALGACAVAGVGYGGYKLYQWLTK